MSLARVPSGPVLAAALLVVAAPFLARLYGMNDALGRLPETLSAALTAHSLVRQGDVDLSEYFPQPAAMPEELRYAFPRRGDRIYAVEPLASSLTFAPFLLPYRRAGPWQGAFVPIGERVAGRVAALAVVVLGLWLLTLVSVPRALVATAVVALATPYRTITGAGLWTHTSAALWLAVGLLAWTRAGRRPALYPLAGAALAVATACRPVLLAAPLFAVAQAWRGPPPRRALAGGTAVLVAALGGLLLWANWSLYGSVLGGRADVVAGVRASHGVPAYFHFSPMHLAGHLVSPSRGLLVWSPVLLFALPGLVASLRGETPPAIRWISAAGIAAFVLYGFIATWWGGWTFGPRYMADLLPFFALWLARTPLPRRGRVPLAAAFVLALGWSLWVQQLGATAYPCGWNDTPVSIDTAPARLWDWRDSQIARCAGWSTPGTSGAP